MKGRTEDEGEERGGQGRRGDEGMKGRRWECVGHNETDKRK